MSPRPETKENRRNSNLMVPLDRNAKFRCRINEKVIQAEYAVILANTSRPGRANVIAEARIK